MKEPNNVGIAELSKSKGINDDPAFSWWVAYKIRKQDDVISSIKSRVRKKRIRTGSI